jgi:hypothetical protein
LPTAKRGKTSKLVFRGKEEHLLGEDVAVRKAMKKAWDLPHHIMI